MKIFHRYIKIRDPVVNKIILNNSQVLKTFAAFQHTDWKLLKFYLLIPSAIFIINGSIAGALTSGIRNLKPK